MRLGTLNDDPCTWEDIEIGEIFAREGCFEIVVKLSHNSPYAGEAMYLANDSYVEHDEGTVTYHTAWGHSYKLYKLPKEMQELWLCP